MPAEDVTALKELGVREIMLQDTPPQAIVDRLTAAIGRGQVADGLAAAVRECGQLVKERGGARKESDQNELSDAPRVVER